MLLLKSVILLASVVQIQQSKVIAWLNVMIIKQCRTIFVPCEDKRYERVFDPKGTLLEKLKAKRR